MNGILQSRIRPTHLVMGSLHGPMNLMRDLPLILTLMSLGITPKGQYKLSVFWMNMLAMERDTPSISLDRLSGSKLS